MRECWKAQLQPDNTVEPENNASVLQLEKQEVSKEGTVIIDYEVDTDYKPEGPDPSNEPVTPERKRKSPLLRMQKWSSLPRDLQTKDNAPLIIR